MQMIASKDVPEIYNHLEKMVNDVDNLIEEVKKSENELENDS